MQDFTGKLAVVTGGASGVGRSLAFALGREGARVLIGDVDREGLGAAEAELRAEGIDGYSAYCDVTDAESVEALAARAFDELGGAQIVFANAGIAAGEAGALWDYSPNDWKWTFNVNVWGVVHTINAFMLRLVAQGEEAHFSITGSGNGAFVVYPDQPVYSATKASVLAITEALYVQTKTGGLPIKVHALMPGPHIVNTGLFDSDRVRPEELDKGDGYADTGIHSVDDMRNFFEAAGMELKLTHPDEVAQTALAGLRSGKFWIAPMNEHSVARARARFDAMIAREDPPVAQLG